MIGVVEKLPGGGGGGSTTTMWKSTGSAFAIPLSIQTVAISGRQRNSFISKFSLVVPWSFGSAFTTKLRQLWAFVFLVTLRDAFGIVVRSVSKTRRH